MQPSKPVRTYLDPDAVGPLPRSALADDSDALAAARTLVLFPEPTQELTAQDMIEVLDPARRGHGSVIPVGYDTASMALPRSRVRPALIGVATGAFLLVVGLVGLRAAPEGPPASPASSPRAAALVAPAAPPVATAPAVTTGTLRVDSAVDGHHVTVDGVPLGSPATVLACGPHEVALGAAGHARTIDVPCGGEVTVFR